MVVTAVRRLEFRHRLVRGRGAGWIYGEFPISREDAKQHEVWAGMQATSGARRVSVDG